LVEVRERMDDEGNLSREKRKKSRHTQRTGSRSDERVCAQK
jgi:hypothetical protein